MSAGGSGTYLAEFCIVFDCIYSTHVAISCFVCRWSLHYLTEFCIVLIRPRGNQLFVCRWSRHFLATFRIVIIPPKWQSAVLSAGGPCTYLADFSIVFDLIFSTNVAISCLCAGGPGTYLQSSVLSLIVFIPPTWQSAVLSAGGPGQSGTTWQLYLFHLTHVAISCFVCRWSWSFWHYLAVIFILPHPRGNQLFVCRWSRHLPGRVL